MNSENTLASDLLSVREYVKDLESYKFFEGEPLECSIKMDSDINSIRYNMQIIQECYNIILCKRFLLELEAYEICIYSDTSTNSDMNTRTNKCKEIIMNLLASIYRCSITNCKISSKDQDTASCIAVLKELKSFETDHSTAAIVKGIVIPETEYSSFDFVLACLLEALYVIGDTTIEDIILTNLFSFLTTGDNSEYPYNALVLSKKIVDTMDRKSKKYVFIDE